MGDADAILSHGDKTVILDNESRGPRWSAEPTFGQTAIAKHVGDIGAHLLNAVLTNGGFVREGIARVGSDVRDAAHGVSRDVTSGQRDILTGLCDVRDSVRQDGSATRERVQSEGRGLSEGQGTIRREIAVESGNIRKDICDTRDAVRSEAGQTRLETLREACLTREVVKDRTDQLARQELEHFGALRLQASENTARLSKELAECCCEVKELVRGEATATRELIQATESARLRDALADAKSEVSQQGLINAIIGLLNKGN